MSYHKARPEKENDPNRPASTVMHSGRIATPHGEEILGGIENAVVEGTARTPDEEKRQIQDYHAGREAVKQAQEKQFDKKTGVPKANVTPFKPDPQGDANAAPAAGPTAPPEEIKKNVEAEKKIEKKPEEKK